MPTVRPLLAAAFAIASFTSSASAQFGGGGLQNFSGALSLNTPIGAFDDLAKPGFGFVFRTGIGDSEAKWSARGNFAFDYFPGRTIYDNIQFLGVGVDLVHRSRPSFYQFLGFGQYSTKYNLKTANSLTSTRSSSDFGFTGGVGVNYSVGEKSKLFVEFAATTVFTGSRNSNWFPVRAGLKF